MYLQVIIRSFADYPTCSIHYNKNHQNSVLLFADRRMCCLKQHDLLLQCKSTGTLCRSAALYAARRCNASALIFIITRYAVGMKQLLP